MILEELQRALKAYDNDKHFINSTSTQKLVETIFLAIFQPFLFISKLFQCYIKPQVNSVLNKTLAVNIALVFKVLVISADPVIW